MGPHKPDNFRRPRVFFDLAAAGKPVGRIVMELFIDLVPKTAENFRCLCTGEMGARLHYKGVRIHRIIKSFMIQGGDIMAGNGTGPSTSIFGGEFEDENLTLKHDRPFLISMANKGPNTNGSQFFITTKPSPHLDGKHVVFGTVVSGQDVVMGLENLEVDDKDAPYERVTVVKCGELMLKKKAATTKIESSSSSSESSSESESSSSSSSTESSSSESSSSEDERESRMRKKRKQKEKERKRKRKEKERKRREEDNEGSDDEAKEKDRDHKERDIDSTESGKKDGKTKEDNRGTTARLSDTGRLLRGRGNMRFRSPSPSRYRGRYNDRREDWRRDDRGRGREREGRWERAIDQRRKPGFDLRDILH
eukprot:Ihof_evm7s48 gene=Ihof_evmTU7s48